MQEEQKNPFIEPENFFAQYHKSMEEMKNNPKIVDFQRLCFELFEMNEQGRAFMKIVTERFLVPSLATPGTATYQLDVLWAEGFKEFARMLGKGVKAHQQRIESGK